MKPLIGLTSYYLNVENMPDMMEAFMEPHIYASNTSYVRRVEKAGGIPVVLPVLLETPAIDGLADRLDGIVFTGGEDIAPERYGETTQGAITPVPERDSIEFKLFEAFFNARKPILAICRGAQLMNVFFGGTLIQDIASIRGKHLEHARDDSPNSPVHGVSLRDGTFAHSLWGKKLEVNSLHHQATDRPGDGLVVSAESEDGLVEALEYPGYPAFMMGVQWHPERLEGKPHSSLFEAFVGDAARIGKEKIRR